MTGSVRRSLPIVVGLAGVVLCALLQPWLWQSVGGLLDLYPIYHGAQAWLSTGDAYWHDPALPDLGQVSDVGNVYPVHAALLFGVPLTLLPPAAAGVVWVLAVGVAWIAAICWARESWYWLAWWPMWDALRIQQASAAVTVGAIVALGALRRDSRIAFLAALPIMAIKPQQTLLLILALVWWGRAWWRGMLAVWGALVVVCFVAQPDWVQQWIASIGDRTTLVQGERWLWWILLPLCTLLFMRGWRVSGLAVASSGLGPWPVAGPYMASLWPLGLVGERMAAVALIGVLGLASLVLGVNYWIFPAVLIAGMALLVWRKPQPEVEPVPPSRPVVRS